MDSAEGRQTMMEFVDVIDRQACSILLVARWLQVEVLHILQTDPHPELESLACAFTCNLYGSLQQGTFVLGCSKICLDVVQTNPLPKHMSRNWMTQRCLAMVCNRFQKAQWQSQERYRVADAVLVLQKTIHRPVMVLCYCDGIPVHITYNNRSGIVASNAVQHTIQTAHAVLRILYLNVKAKLQQDTDFVGTAYGQLSSYVLFWLVYAIHISFPDSISLTRMWHYIACLMATYHGKDIRIHDTLGNRLLHRGVDTGNILTWIGQKLASHQPNNTAHQQI